MEFQYPVVPQHGRVALEPVEQFARARVAAELEHPADLLPVEQHIVRVYRCHHARILERGQPAGRRAAREQHEAQLRMLPDESAQRLLFFRLLHLLQIIHQQDFPRSVRLRQRKTRLPRRNAAHPPPGEQRFRCRGLAETAGRAEQKHAAMLQKARELLGDRSLYYGFSA